MSEEDHLQNEVLLGESTFQQTRIVLRPWALHAHQLLCASTTSKYCVQKQIGGKLAPPIPPRRLVLQKSWSFPPIIHVGMYGTMTNFCELQTAGSLPSVIIERRAPAFKLGETSSLCSTRFFSQFELHKHENPRHSHNHGHISIDHIARAGDSCCSGRRQWSCTNSTDGLGERLLQADNIDRNI